MTAEGPRRNDEIKKDMFYEGSLREYVYQGRGMVARETFPRKKNSIEKQ